MCRRPATRATRPWRTSSSTPARRSCRCARCHAVSPSHRVGSDISAASSASLPAPLSRYTRHASLLTACDLEGSEPCARLRNKGTYGLYVSVIWALPAVRVLSPCTGEPLSVRHHPARQAQQHDGPVPPAQPAGTGHTLCLPPQPPRMRDNQAGLRAQAGSCVIHTFVA